MTTHRIYARSGVRMGAAVRAAGKPQFVVGKDYALSYLLLGIVETPLLSEMLVFKGGTCLRKAYSPGYRFSEDLDCGARAIRESSTVRSLLDVSTPRHEVVESFAVIKKKASTNHLGVVDSHGCQHFAFWNEAERPADCSEVVDACLPEEHRFVVSDLYS